MEREIGQRRIESLDIIRGMSLLGILLVNIQDFFSPLFFMDPFVYLIGSLDRALYIGSDILVQASFYPIFAFLFGYGNLLLIENRRRRGERAGPYFVRRMFVLLLFGTAHAFLVWHGDILILYSLFGISLLLVSRMSGKQLLWFGSLLYLIPASALSLLFLAAGGEADYGHETAAAAVYQSGTFAEITVQRAADWYSVNQPLALPILFLSIFPLFVIGAGAAKQGWLEQPSRCLGKLRTICFISLAGGLLLKLLPYFLTGQQAAAFIQDQLGGPLLSCFYITAAVLLLRKERVLKVGRFFAYSGKMSLTQYLLQSVIFTFISYGYGLGMYGKISYTGCMVMAVFFYFGQAAAARKWLSSGRRGPAEVLWRTLSGKGAGKRGNTG